MKKLVVRGVVAAALTGLAVAGTAAPALAAEAAPAPAAPAPVAPAVAPAASDGGPAVVDEPDTGDLNNIYTFAPLGVPVLGLVRSLNAVPGKILPSFGS